MSSHSVENIKRGSAGLRGTLLASLADSSTGALAEDDQTLIKYHGSYQQDDRDVREERRRQKLEPEHSFMIRTRTPGGVTTPAQWLQLDRISRTYASSGLRITTRQAFQFHGIIKRELKATMQAINTSLMDTLAACGDVNRNVAVSANPLDSGLHARVQADAALLSQRLLPRTRAYYEIWLDEKPLDDSGSEEDPIYGEAYLPRKFKIGFAIPPYNDVDVFAQDLGFIAIVNHGELVGYNVSVGGGMGATHGDPETYPRIGSVLGFITPDQTVAVAEAVVTTQRDWGNRIQRKRARLKYTLDDRGVEAFKTEIEQRSGLRFAPPREVSFEHNGDRFGWIEGVDGHAHLTLRLLSGRIIDHDGQPHQTGLRQIAKRLYQADAGGAHFRLTANQNVVIADVPNALRDEINALVTSHALDLYEAASPLRRNAIACVALPTCGLAMAEAERYLPDFLTRVEALLSHHGLERTPINLRISGCPNGCARPYLAEIALVGRAPGRYNLMLGGDHRGERLNTLYRENITEERILKELDVLFARFARERLEGERFGDFLHRGRVVGPGAFAVELIA